MEIPGNFLNLSCFSVDSVSFYVKRFMVHLELLLKCYSCGTPKFKLMAAETQWSRLLSLK